MGEEDDDDEDEAIMTVMNESIEYRRTDYCSSKFARDICDDDNDDGQRNSICWIDVCKQNSK